MHLRSKRGSATVAVILPHVKPGVHDPARCGDMARHAYDLVTALDLSTPDTWDYQLFRKRFETSPLGSCIVDESGNILDVNMALLDVTRTLDLKAFIKAGFDDMHSPEDLERLKAFRNEVFAQGWSSHLTTTSLPSGPRQTAVFGIRVNICNVEVCVSWGDSVSVDNPRQLGIHRRPPPPCKIHAN